jgi:hypothetical protein
MMRHQEEPTYADGYSCIAMQFDPPADFGRLRWSLTVAVIATRC